MKQTPWLHLSGMLVLLFCLVLVLASCSEASITGDLVIDFGSEGSRSIQPENLRVTWIRVTGSLNSNPEVTLTATDCELGSPITIPGLSVGVWTINVVGYAQIPSAVGAVPLTAMATDANVIIRSGRTTSARFTLHYLSTGTGNADVRVEWTGTHPVHLTGKLSNGTEVSAGYASNGANILRFRDVPVGDYGLDVTLRSPSGAAVPFPMVDMVNFYSNQTSVGTVDLTGVVIPVAPQPSITAAAEDTHDDPLQAFRTVSIESALDDAIIYYTTDGTSPGFSSLGVPNSSTSVYTAPFEITYVGDTTVHAIASRDGYYDCYASSQVITVNGTGTGEVIITDPVLVRDVVITQPAAPLANFTVTYTATGSPVITATWYLDDTSSAATDIDGDGDQMTFTPALTTAGTHRVIVKLSYVDGSSTRVVSASKYFTPTQVAAPVLTVTDIVGGKEVTMDTTTDGAAMHCTVDGSTPTTSSTLYPVPLRFSLPSTTVKAIASKPGMVDSAVAESTITVEQVAAPTFGPSAGSYADAVGITLSGQDGTTIYYTTDTADPTTGSSVYSDYLPIHATTTVKAMATCLGMANSTVSSAIYTITSRFPIGSTGPANGKIFYINADPSITTWKYLEAATADETEGAIENTYDAIYGYVYAPTNTEVGGTGEAIGTGAANTARLMAVLGTSVMHAARICDQKSVTVGEQVFDDWFLPSREEIYQMYLQRDVIGSFVDHFYWSSSEALSVSDAYLQSFQTGNKAGSNKNSIHLVRAVRAFLE